MKYRNTHSADGIQNHRDETKKGTSNRRCPRKPIAPPCRGKMARSTEIQCRSPHSGHTKCEVEEVGEMPHKKSQISAPVEALIRAPKTETECLLSLQDQSSADREYPQFHKHTVSFLSTQERKGTRRKAMECAREKKSRTSHRRRRVTCCVARAPSSPQQKIKIGKKPNQRLRIVHTNCSFSGKAHETAPLKSRSPQWSTTRLLRTACEQIAMPLAPREPTPSGSSASTHTNSRRGKKPRAPGIELERSLQHYPHPPHKDKGAQPN